MKLKKKKKKCKGHGWSKKGSKKQRREERKKSLSKRFHAVARGWRPGIFKLRKNAMAQTNGFLGAMMKSCDTLFEAEKFLCENRRTPPGVKTPFPPAPNTPVPPEEYVYPSAYIVPTASWVDEEPLRYQSLEELTGLIAKNGTHEDIIQYEPCKSLTCQYSTGCLVAQRWELLRRLVQIEHFFKKSPHLYGKATTPTPDLFFWTHTWLSDLPT